MPKAISVIFIKYRVYRAKRRAHDHFFECSDLSTTVQNKIVETSNNGSYTSQANITTPLCSLPACPREGDHSRLGAVHRSEAMMPAGGAHLQTGRQCGNGNHCYDGYLALPYDVVFFCCLPRRRVAGPPSTSSFFYFYFLPQVQRVQCKRAPVFP